MFRVSLALEYLVCEYFGFILENKMATLADFCTFFSIFPHPLTLAVIATVFNLSGQINYYMRFLENVVLECVCLYVCTGSVG